MAMPKTIGGHTAVTIHDAERAVALDRDAGDGGGASSGFMPTVTR